MTDVLDFKDYYQREFTFEFDLLDSSANKIGVLEVDGSSVPAVSHDVTRSINRTMSSIIIAQSDANEVDFFSDRLRPVVVINTQERKPLGTYLFGGSSKVTSSRGTTKTASLVDQAFIVDLPIEKPMSFGQKTTVTTAIEIILASVGGFEYLIDPSPIILGDTPLTWQSGTTALKVVNDLCRLIGYLPLHFNNTGIGIVKLAPDFSAAYPRLSYKKGQNIVDDSLIENLVLDAPNRYVVVDTASTKPLVGVYDVPDAVPHSYANRGYFIRKTIEVQGLASVAQANFAAQTEAQQDKQQGQSSFSGIPDPRHDSYDLLWVDGERYLELGWNLPLEEGAEMQHTLVKVL